MRPLVNLVHGNTVLTELEVLQQSSAPSDRDNSLIISVMSLSNPCKCSFGFVFLWLLLVGPPVRDFILTCSLN